jgi:flagellar basal body-associated protein FliL
MAEDAGGRPPVGPAAAASLVVLVALTIAAYAWMAQRSAERGTGDPVDRPPEVALGAPFQRSFAAGEELEVRVILILDAGREDREALRNGVRARVDALRSVINQDVIHARPESDFRAGTSTVEMLKIAIRDRVNRELQAAGFGADVVRDVTLPDLVLPAAAP